MIIRIVKMEFKPENVDQFISIFTAYKELIRNADGCTHLILLNDINTSTLFFTYSHWQSENDLNNYRKSVLFKTVWSKTKILFSDKPEAWSVEPK